MAQIPYSPIPDVTPQFAPTPEIHVNTPEAGFGGAVATALSKAGTAGTEASNELYQRAQAMQQLKNETDSRNASIDFATKADQSVAAFKTQFGENAGPEQYAQFQKGIADLREQARKNLTSPMAQKQFDGEAANITINSLKYGAFHSAEQLKQANITSNKVAVETINNSVLAHPEDEAAYNAAMVKARTHVEELAQAQGWDPATTIAETDKAQSTLTKNRITGIANNGDILGAKKMFDDANKNNALVGEDRDKLQHYLNTQENTHGSRVVADQTRDGSNGAMGHGSVDFERTAGAVRQIESTNNYSLLAGPEGHRKIGAYSILEPFYKDYLQNAGIDPDTPISEFIANHAMQDKVFKAHYDAGVKSGHSANEIAGAWQQGHYAGQGKDVTDSNSVDRAGYEQRFNAALYKGSSLSQRADAARAHAAAIAPENKELPDFVENHTIADYNHEKAEDKANNDTAQNIIASAIQEQSTKGPVTVSNLMKTSPEFAEIYQKMPLDKQLQLSGRLTQLSKQDNTATPSRESNYNTLQGQAYIDPEGFKSKDFVNAAVDLRSDDRKALIALQNQIIHKNVVPDPALQGAIRDPGVISVANTIGAGPANREEWHTFTGALAEDIKLARARGESVTTNSVQDMANKLAQERAGTGWFTNSREYQIPTHSIPEAQRKRAAEEIRKTRGPDYEPNDLEIENMHARVLYNATVRTSNAGR